MKSLNEVLSQKLKIFISCAKLGDLIFFFIFLFPIVMNQEFSEFIILLAMY